MLLKTAQSALNYSSLWQWRAIAFHEGHFCPPPAPGNMPAPRSVVILTPSFILTNTETDTVLLDRHRPRQLRVLRTATTEAHEFAVDGDAIRTLVRGVGRLYAEGEMESGFASIGEAAGRIGSVLTVAEIIQQTVDEFEIAISRLAGDHL